MIWFSPYPPGKAFAVTFVDDTDFSTRDNTEPVYDLLAHHGFWGTKTIWPLRAKRNSAFRRDLEASVPTPSTGSTLEDPDYASFVEKLRNLGFEIALHGTAAGNSTRQETLMGLAHFVEKLGSAPTMCAFHQINIENLYAGRYKLDSMLFRTIERLLDRSSYEGHDEGSPYFWGDIAHDTFRYVRLPFHTIDEINTLRVNPSMPFRDPRRPFVRRWFAASDGADVVRFNRLLSEPNVQRLASERGACVIYTHFAKSFARPHPGGHVLDADFVRTVERLTRTADGWFVTATALLDRIASVNALHLNHQGREVRIHNRGDQSVDNVVMHVPSNLQVQCIDAPPLERFGDAVVLPTIAADATITLAASTHGAQVIEPRSAEIPRRERKAIEYWNYLGLIRGEIKDRIYYSSTLNGLK